VIVKITFDDREEMLEAAKILTAAMDEFSLLDMPATAAYFERGAREKGSPLCQIELKNGSCIQLFYKYVIEEAGASA
jgi:hypothetical protein